MRARPVRNKRRERLQALAYALLCVMVAAAGFVSVMLAASGTAGAAGAAGESPVAAAAGGTVLPEPEITPTIAALTATPAGPTPTPTPAPTKAPYQVDLYRDGSFVSQMNRDYCTAGAIQNMVNIIGPTSDLTTARQQEIGNLVVSLTTRTDSLNGGFGPMGWALTMPRLGAGVGRYKLVVDDTFDKAMRDAAISLRANMRPVGLLTWWGAHSWVMSGFKADDDPALFPKTFKLSGAFIVDPFYPRVSSIWGQTLPPDTFRDMAAMAHNYIGWKRPEGPYPGRDGKWLLVIPN